MIVIADNLNVRNRAFAEALAGKDKKAVSEMAARLALADMINVQCSLDGAGDEECLPWVVEAVASVGKPVSIDSRNVKAIRKSLGPLRTPPLINYASATEPDDLDGLLDIVAECGASLVVRASRATPPSTLEAKLQIIEDLLEEANSADIPNERVFADPSVVHVGRGAGQRHLTNSTECIRVLKELVDPPVKTIVWVSNVSTGLPKSLRKKIEAAFLLFAAGAGLDAAMLDVLDPEVSRAVYLVRAFRDEVVFSAADMA